MKEPFMPFVFTMIAAIFLVNVMQGLFTPRVDGAISGFLILLIGWMGYFTKE